MNQVIRLPVVDRPPRKRRFESLIIWLRGLKPFSKLFILAEGLDIFTTMLGLLVFPQVREANPLLFALGGWTQLIGLKLLATICAVFILEKVRWWPKLVWTVPSIALLPAFWNTLCLAAEVFLS